MPLLPTCDCSSSRNVWMLDGGLTGETWGLDMGLDELKTRFQCCEKPRHSVTIISAKILTTTKTCLPQASKLASPVDLGTTFHEFPGMFRCGLVCQLFCQPTPSGRPQNWQKFIPESNQPMRPMCQPTAGFFGSLKCSLLGGSAVGVDVGGH